MIVNVEVKCLPWEPDADTPDHDVARGGRGRARSAAVANDDVIVSSFDLAAVDACPRSRRSSRPAWLTQRSGDVRGRVDRAASTGTRGSTPIAWPRSRGADERYRAAHALPGVRLNVWTVDDPAEIARTSPAAGVDGIITNVPDVAIAALEHRRGEERRVKGRGRRG